MTEDSVALSTDLTQDGAPTGTLRWEIKNISQLTNSNRLSPYIEFNGIPWRAVAYKKPYKGSNYLGIHFHGMENDSRMWSIDVSSRFTVINKDPSKNAKREFAKHNYNFHTRRWGFNDIIQWTNLIDEEKGFISDDKIIVEIRFTLTNIRGIKNPVHFNFTDANDECHDMILVVEGKKVHVGKQYLAVHSPFFRSMFYKDFTEKNKKEIELKDVKYEDFIEMLNVIYPSGKKITDDTAERLLSVGDRFQIKMIIDQVEQFLIASTKFTVAAKLKLSGQYRLVLLQGACLDSLKTISDVTILKKSNEYMELSDETQLALLDKIMKLTT